VGKINGMIRRKLSPFDDPIVDCQSCRPKEFQVCARRRRINENSRLRVKAAAEKVFDIGFSKSN
jgi:hypothetical protein